jgi:uncharacterized protein
MLAQESSSTGQVPLSLIQAARIAGELNPAPITPAWVIDGNPQARGRKLFESLDGLVTSFVWECSEGRFNWYYSCDETILLLEGSITLESDTMPKTRYGAGDVILFRKGAHARWHVEGHVKKLAICQTVLPTFFGAAIPLLRSLKRTLSSMTRIGPVQKPLQVD